MNRRTFFGAAAAALSLPASGEAAAESAVDVTEQEDLGSGVASVEGQREAKATVELGAVDDEAEFQTQSYWYDDRPPEVEVRAYTGPAELFAYFSPEEARGLAADLATAARHAEKGAARARGEGEVVVRDGGEGR